jgi:hypothetical protein
LKVSFLAQAVDEAMPRPIVYFSRADDGWVCHECGFWFHSEVVKSGAYELIYEQHEKHHAYGTAVKAVIREAEKIKGEQK